MQTVAFENFAAAWKNYIVAKRIVGRRFDSGINLLRFIMDIAKEFVEGRNPYTNALTKNEHKCACDFVHSVGHLLRQCDVQIKPKGDYAEASRKLSSFVSSDRRKKSPFLGPKVERVEEFFRVEPKVSTHAVESTFLEMIADKRVVDESLLESIGRFMAEIDLFVADNARIEIKIPPQKPFSKDTLQVFQEVLGALHNSNDKESLREQDRVERFLKSLDVEILWPNEEVVEENVNFLVIYVPGEVLSRSVKPYLRFENIIFRGEKIMPA